MTTTVYCADRELILVSGTQRKGELLLAGAHREPLPEGVIRGGRIVDELELGGALQSLVERELLPRRGVVLLLSPAVVETRRVSVPLQGEAKLRQIATGEFEEEKSVIADYAVLQPRSEGGAGGVILCGAVEAELLDGYREAFCAAGVKLRRVDGAPGAVARFAQWAFPGEELCFGILEEGLCYLVQLHGGVCTSVKTYREAEPATALLDFAERGSRVVLAGAGVETLYNETFLEEVGEARLRCERLGSPLQVECRATDGTFAPLIYGAAALLREGVYRG